LLIVKSIFYLKLHSQYKLYFYKYFFFNETDDIKQNTLYVIVQRCMISHSVVMHFTLATFKSDPVQSILVHRELTSSPCGYG